MELIVAGGIDASRVGVIDVILQYQRDVGGGWRFGWAVASIPFVCLRVCVVFFLFLRLPDPIRTKRRRDKKVTRMSA